VPILWPLIFASGHEIAFAHTSFKWANLASHNAGVTVAIVGISNPAPKVRKIFSITGQDETVVKEVQQVNAYLVPGQNIVVDKLAKPLSNQSEMNFGNKPVDGGYLLLSKDEVTSLHLSKADEDRFIKRISGSAEFIRGVNRYCLWISDDDLSAALKIKKIAERIESVKKLRLESRDKGANEMANRPHQFREMHIGKNHTIIVPRVSSEARPILPVGLLEPSCAVSDAAFAMHDSPLWNLALIASKLHRLWI